MSIYRFRQFEITFYIVGIILTFMTYVLVFHWYGDHFPSRYLSTGRLICYLSHSCKYSWPAQIIFSLISIFLTMYCTLRFSAIYCDRREQNLLASLPFHQELLWATGWMNHDLPLGFAHRLFYSRSFISYALVSSWFPYRWIIRLNTLPYIK